MYKPTIVALVVACCLALIVSGAPIREGDDVQEGMKSAFQRGLERFGNGVEANEVSHPVRNENRPRVFSQYTQGLTALGGGKPLIREQYRLHNYTPLAPSVLPRSFVVSNRMTPQEAANIYRPSPPLQFTTDILH